MDEIKRTCPHPRCSKEIPREQFACQPHWYGLPMRIRRAIYKGCKLFIEKRQTVPLEAAHAEAKLYWERAR